MSTRGMIIVLICVLAPSAVGQTIISGGNTGSVNGPSGPIFVENGSTLNVTVLASISGSVLAPSGLPLSLYGDSTSTINMNGGEVLASGSSGNYAGIGIEALGYFTASGGSVIGADGTAALEGGIGLLAAGPVQISGGSFQGGAGPYAGVGAILTGSFATAASDSISGGYFIGGSSSAAGAIGGGEGLEIMRGGANSISGGTFVAGTNLSSQSYSVVYQAAGANNSLTISGGIFSGPIEFYTDNDPTGSMSFLGFGLSLSEVANRLVLTGTLADGDSIDNVICVSGSYSVYLNGGPSGLEELTLSGIVGSVPEPSSWIMLGSSIVALAIARWRRSAKRSRR
jgi:hypothetical protein